ncbi:WD40 repeat-like protein [Aspergillus campestris IBT 28561]|uniref:WD40 repeat-like protein n=1 Tax=Aspergillus campestris (strain IBT 28561) TaxID=1392248 RepID=A0A2I1D7M3_ASPC2|nr:WD40 repeat-like protein [Aspergillus campestris IBT 28561]PKY05869.1 WD40 repeat-like protein [Aspergillus campestris IBT 28561]
MVKRKRQETAKAASTQPSKTIKPTTPKPAPTPKPTVDDPAVTLQIVTGSYESVLHGFTAAVSPSSFDSKSTDKKQKDETPTTDPSLVQFSDTFLFEAHASAIRCLALSPMPSASESGSEAQKITLASGSSDERVNLYSLSAHAPAAGEDFPSLPSLSGQQILENPKNKELGTLLHHDASVSSLSFPSRSKLLAGSDDNSISVTKTRDWTVVSTIKAPRPKMQGRPSGDTAPPGGSPTGVNDFAVHPSMKVMLSVGKGEKCMRLWNLVTGKKAGVLNFTREMLMGVKEGKWSTGEGRKIIWNSKGEEFAVAFEWGAVVFGIDSTPICRVLPSPRSKLHEMKYVSVDPSSEDSEELLAVSTEDGRIGFYSTQKTRKSDDEAECPIPYAEAVAQLGGKPCGLPGRVKDFEIMNLKNEPAVGKNDFLVVTGGSEGLVRVWLLRGKELVGEKSKPSGESATPVRQVGRLLNAYETGHRITCLKAFVMLPPSAAEEEQDEELDSEEDSDSDSEASDSEA